MEAKKNTPVQDVEHLKAQRRLCRSEYNEEIGIGANSTGGTKWHLDQGYSNKDLLIALRDGMPKKLVPSPSAIDVARIAASMPADFAPYRVGTYSHTMVLLKYINEIAIIQWLESKWLGVELAKSDDDLLSRWSKPVTGKEFLSYLRAKGYLEEIKYEGEVVEIVGAFKKNRGIGGSDLFKCYLAIRRNITSKVEFEEFYNDWLSRVFWDGPAKMLGEFLKWRDEIKAANKRQPRSAKARAKKAEK